MRYEFNTFALDTALFELQENAVSLKIEPQVIELLVLLTRNIPDTETLQMALTSLCHLSLKSRL
jgi:hypothetical protein